jgi:hypothetical protein
VADGPVTLLLRASGIEVDPAGSIEGTVVTSTFQGDQVVLEVAVAGAPPLELRVGQRHARVPGATVRVAIRPDAVVALRR